MRTKPYRIIAKAIQRVKRYLMIPLMKSERVYDGIQS